MIPKSNSVLVVSILWGVMFVSSTQFFIMSPLLPQVARQYCADELLLGTIVGSYSLALGVSALFAGYFSDGLGRRKILLWGTGAMGLTLLLHVLAYNYTALVVIRFITGIGGGLLTGSCVAYVRDYFPFEKRGKANGWVLTGAALGQIAGIPAGILFADLYGIEGPFVVLGLLMSLIFLLIMTYLPEPIKQRTTSELGDFNSLLHEYQSLLKQKFYQKAVIGYILMFFSITVYMVYFPKWLEETKAATASDLAFLFLLGGVATLFAGPISGGLSDRAGRIPVATTSNLALAGAMGGSLFFRLSVFDASVVFFAVMFFMSSRSVSYQSMIADKTCDDHRGKSLNLLIAFGQVGMVLGSVLSGFIYSYFGFAMNTIAAGLVCIGMAWLVASKWPQPAEITTKKAASDLSIATSKKELTVDV